MELNCRKDDVAYVMANTGQNVGRFVQCLRLVPDQLWQQADGSVERLPSWELDREILAYDGSRHRFCPDRSLRPIRDPGDDAVDSRDVLLGQRAAA
jgi:hypothetical protein